METLSAHLVSERRVRRKKKKGSVTDYRHFVLSRAAGADISIDEIALSAQVAGEALPPEQITDVNIVS